jgi:hypothetical protein
MSVTTIYPIIMMPSKYTGHMTLLWYFNGYYSPDMSIHLPYPTGIIIMREYCIIDVG